MQLRVDFENVKAEEGFFWVLKSHVILICGVVSRDYFFWFVLFVCLFVGIAKHLFTDRDCSFCCYFNTVWSKSMNVAAFVYLKMSQVFGLKLLEIKQSFNKLLTFSPYCRSDKWVSASQLIVVKVQWWRAVCACNALCHVWFITWEAALLVGKCCFSFCLENTSIAWFLSEWKRV